MMMTTRSSSSCRREYTVTVLVTNRRRGKSVGWILLGVALGELRLSLRCRRERIERTLRGGYN